MKKISQNSKLLIQNSIKFAYLKKNPYLCSSKLQCELKISTIMAKPISVTPTLTGKNAEAFLTKMHTPAQPISQESYQACKSAYHMMQAMAQ